jgi:hypothetical protein
MRRLVLEAIDGQLRQSWRDTSGTILVEHYAIDGMAHAVPIDAKGSFGAGVSSAPFAFDAGISSTMRIAKSWQLLQQPASEEALVEPLVSDPLPNGQSWLQRIESWFKSANA